MDERSSLRPGLREWVVGQEAQPVILKAQQLGKTLVSTQVVNASVLIIGNEILSGRTQDTNLRDIANRLGEWGIRVAEARVIPDDEGMIVAAVREAKARYDYVFTTGGIGPTHDDITAACIAKAFNTKLVENELIAELIRSRSQDVPQHVLDSRLRMAMIPEGGGLVENPGGPPGFFIENVYVLAGIPSVMRDMLATLEGKLRTGERVFSASVTAYITESTVAQGLGQLQTKFPQVDIGSYPFRDATGYGTRLVVRGTDRRLLDELCEQIQDLVRDSGGKLGEA